MEAKKFENYLTFNDALNKIKQNKSNGYEWYPVKTDAGCFIELGGTNKNELELKAYICELDDKGQIKTYSNGFVNSRFSIDIHQGISLSEGYADVNIKDNEKLIKFLNKTADLNTMLIDFESVYGDRPIIGYRLVTKIKGL